MSRTNENINMLMSSSGYTGPFNLDDITVMESIHRHINSPGFEQMDRHIDCSSILHIFHDRNLQNIIHRISADPWLLWRTNFFFKSDGSGEIRWHHDKHFQSGDSPIDFDELGSHLSVIFALNDMDTFNGAFEIIPGSHISVEGFYRDDRPFHMRNISDHFINLPDWLAEKRITIEMRKGQFLVFHSALLHRSLPFSGSTPRVSMIGRLVKRGVQLPPYLQHSDAVVPFSNFEKSI